MSRQRIELYDGQAHDFDGDRPSDSLESQWHRAYFCTVCGEVWARWISANASRFYAIHRSCPQHRSYENERPGSLVVNVREDLAILPPALLVRELQLEDA